MYDLSAQALVAGGHRDELQGGQGEAPDGLRGLAVGGQTPRLRPEGVPASARGALDVLVQDRQEQLGLAREVGVDGPLGEARGPGDPVEPGAVVAGLGEGRACSEDDGLASLSLAVAPADRIGKVCHSTDRKGAPTRCTPSRTQILLVSKY